MIAREIMNKDVILLQEDTTIEEVAEILTKNKISGAPVVNKEGKMVGLVTEGDLLQRETNPRAPGYLNILGAFIYINGLERFREDLKKIAATKTSEIMTTNVISVDSGTKVEKVAALLMEHNIKRVPVIEGDRIIGIISRADIIRAMAGIAGATGS